MTDYSLWRDEAMRMGSRDMRIAAPELVGLIDELESLRAQVKPAKAGSKYPPAFDAAYGAMAAIKTKWRAGSTKPAAFLKWKERINAGASEAEMIAGAEKYAAHCKATGREVAMAQTFFGRGEHYTADWAIPASAAKKAQGEKFHFDGMDRSGDQAAQAASMARHGVTISDDEVKF